MPKIEEFCSSRASGLNDDIYNEILSASEAITLGILAHFRHFRHF